MAIEDLFMFPYFVFNHLAVGPLVINSWGFFAGLAFVAGYLFVLFQARQKNIPDKNIIILVLAIFIGAALGSRAGYLLQFPNEWLADVSLLWRFDQGGLILWGGIFGGFLGGWVYIKIAKLNLWQIADLATPAIALGMGIGRIGCFLINDHVGAPTTLPWGILWPDGIARHPVALYELLVGFGLFAILLLVGKKILPGRLFLLFLVSYSVTRFFLDFLRIRDGILADPHWWAFTTSQWISLLLLTIILLYSIIVNQKFLRFFNKKSQI